MQSEKIFFITSSNRNYVVKASSWATVHTVWASEKCWFIPGTVVKISDISEGISKNFVKEKE